MKIHVPDMTCQHCVKSITEGLLEIDAKAHVTCNVATHEVTVETDCDATLVKQAIVDAGFTVS
jgi:copper chaperone